MSQYETFFPSTQTPHLWCAVGLNFSPMLTWYVIDDFGNLAVTHPCEPWLEENWTPRSCFVNKPVVALTPEWH